MAAVEQDGHDRTRTQKSRPGAVASKIDLPRMERGRVLRFRRRSLFSVLFPSKWPESRTIERFRWRRSVLRLLMKRLPLWRLVFPVLSSQTIAPVRSRAEPCWVRSRPRSLVNYSRNDLSIVRTAPRGDPDKSCAQVLRRPFFTTGRLSTLTLSNCERSQHATDSSRGNAGSTEVS